jgi:hypothetical protein
LLKIGTQGVSLWHFHVYMYYNMIWFISSIFLPTLVPFFWCFSQFKNSIFILVWRVRQPYYHIHFNFLLKERS